MPVMDGWEAARWLKSEPQTRDIPIVALSAHALVGEREKAFAAGCDAFDESPFSSSVCWQPFAVSAGPQVTAPDDLRRLTTLLAFAELVARASAHADTRH